MERRWCQRKPIAMEVVLYYAGLGLVRCKAMDLSYDGAYIETGEAMIPARARVELYFDDGHQEQPDSVRIPARVVHAGHGGMGVLFSDYEGHAYRFLQSRILT